MGYTKNIIKQIPALKFLLPLTIGILLQFHLAISFNLMAALVAVALSFLIPFTFLSNSQKFKWSWLKGLLITLVFVGLGGCLSYTKNTSNRPAWVGKYFKQNEPVLATLQENLVIKEKSFKALATVNAVYLQNKWQPVEGEVLLYFKKDSTTPKLQYGSQILITKNLDNIINSGNPGGFDYKQYCSFKGIYYQGFLNDNNYTILPTTKINWFANFLIKIRISVLYILKSNIKNPNELSIAEAQLIGYREELDRDLVRAYSNTGVVHIIAISGLHLGMIYALILWIFTPLKKYKWSKLVKPITIILVLWMFSFIAGMAPSILRSAIMFTCIAIAETFEKRNNIYNGLALSAFIILIINPFSLWDVGFQLSYAAILSIVIFSPYIKKWVYVKNNILLFCWNLNAITLSAQILTLPIVIYHFHQFPVLFLFTNLFAVTWSCIILYSELLLLILSSWHFAANLIGKAIEWMIWLMNSFILKVDILWFSVIESLQINILQAFCLAAIIVGFSYWLIQKNTKSFVFGLFFLVILIAVRGIDFCERNNQQKLIVYNVPNHTAIDLIEGRKFDFIGDSILQKNGFLKNFHIKPSRILNRVVEPNELNNIYVKNNFIFTKNKLVAIINKPVKIDATVINVDAIIISKNPRIFITELTKKFNCKQFIFDGSNPAWKIRKWQKDCDSLHLQYHICSINGAFEMNL